MSTPPITAPCTLTLKIGTIVIDLPAAESVLGRSGHPSEAQPDISLDRFGAQNKGVSRRHIRIRCTGDVMVVTDLGSANGTVLNGERLKPSAEYQIRDGDQLTLGTLTITVRL